MVTYKLYDTLGVQKSASQQEIKRAYHRLALECHPDKAGEAGTERFKEVQNAYSMLSDGARRALYDRYGDQGMETMQSGAVSSVVLHPKFGVMGSVAALVVGVMSLLFLSFLSAHEDNKISWSWACVFIPLWVLVFLMVPVWGLCIWQLVLKRFSGAIIFATVQLGALIAAPITIYLRIEGRLGSWSAALSPLILWSTVMSISMIPSLSLDHLKLMWEGSGMPTERLTKTSREYVIHVVGCVLQMLYPLVFWVLLCLRLEGTVTYSYYVVFSPFYVYAPSMWVLATMGMWCQKDLHPDVEGTCATVATPSIMLLVSEALPLTFSVLLPARLDDSDSHSVGIVMVPLFIMAGMLTMGSLMATINFSVQAASMEGSAAAEHSTAAGESVGGDTTTSPQGSSGDLSVRPRRSDSVVGLA